MSRKTVITVHGINTAGEWQEVVGRELKRVGFVHVKYPYAMSILEFLHPSWRRKACKTFVGWYEKKFAPSPTTFAEAPSVIAHSFGTYLVGRGIARSDILFDRVVLIAPILRRGFDWPEILRGAQARVDAVKVDWSPADPWPYVASLVGALSLGFDLGSSGSLGFWSRSLLGRRRSAGFLYPQRLPRFRHSDALTSARFHRWWYPFLVRERSDLWVPQRLRGQPSAPPDVSDGEAVLAELDRRGDGGLGLSRTRLAEVRGTYDLCVPIAARYRELWAHSLHEPPGRDSVLLVVCGEAGFGKTALALKILVDLTLRGRVVRIREVREARDCTGPELVGPSGFLLDDFVGRDDVVAPRVAALEQTLDTLAQRRERDVVMLVMRTDVLRRLELLGFRKLSSRYGLTELTARDYVDQPGLLRLILRSHLERAVRAERLSVSKCAAIARFEDRIHARLQTPLLLEYFSLYATRYIPDGSRVTDADVDAVIDRMGKPEECVRDWVRELPSSDQTFLAAIALWPGTTVGEFRGDFADKLVPALRSAGEDADVDSGASDLERRLRRFALEVTRTGEAKRREDDHQLDVSHPSRRAGILAALPSRFGARLSHVLAHPLMTQVTESRETRDEWITSAVELLLQEWPSGKAALPSDLAALTKRWAARYLSRVQHRLIIDLRLHGRLVELTEGLPAEPDDEVRGRLLRFRGHALYNDDRYAAALREFLSAASALEAAKEMPPRERLAALAHVYDHIALSGGHVWTDAQDLASVERYSDRAFRTAPEVYYQTEVLSHKASARFRFLEFDEAVRFFGEANTRREPLRTRGTAVTVAERVNRRVVDEDWANAEIGIVAAEALKVLYRWDSMELECPLPRARAERLRSSVLEPAGNVLRESSAQLGYEHPFMASLLSAQALLLIATGAADSALAMVETGTPGRVSPFRRGFLSDVKGLALVRSGDFGGAEAAFREAHRLFEGIPSQPRRYASTVLLAYTLFRRRRVEEAARLLDAAEEYYVVVERGTGFAAGRAWVRALRALLGPS